MPVLYNQKTIYFAPCGLVLPTKFFMGWSWMSGAVKKHLEAGAFYEVEKYEDRSRRKIRKLLTPKYQLPMGFTPQDCDNLRADLKKVFEKYHEDTEIHLSMGNMTYSDTDITFKVSAKRIAKGVDPELESLRLSLKKYGRLYGLSEKDFLRPLVTKNGEKMVLLGIKPRARKFPLIVKKANGKRFRYSEKVLENNRG